MRLASYPFILGMHTYGPNSTVLESNQLIHWKRIIIIITPTISMRHKQCIHDFKPDIRILRQISIKISQNNFYEIKKVIIVSLLFILTTRPTVSACFGNFDNNIIMNKMNGLLVGIARF